MTNEEYPDFHGDYPFGHAEIIKDNCSCGKNCNCLKNCDCATCECKICSDKKCSCGDACKCKI